MTTAQVARKALTLASQAVFLKAALQVKARRRTIAKELHQREAVEFERVMTDALKPLFENQIKSVAEALNLLSGQEKGGPGSGPRLGVPRGPYKVKPKTEPEQKPQELPYSLGGVLFTGCSEQKFREIATRFFDLKTQSIDIVKRVAKASGAPSGSDVEFLTSSENPDRIVVNFNEKSCEGRRVFKKSNGSITVENDSFEANVKGSGIGTRMLYQQATEAASLGVKDIFTMAAGNSDSDMNGYYTWPRLGFDGRLQSSTLEAAHLDGFSEVSKISDLMKTADGRKWWREYGVGHRVTFDLSEGSQSRRVLDEYVKQKFGPEGGKSAGHGRGRRSDPGQDLGQHWEGRKDHGGLSANQIFNPEDWDEELINRALPVMAVQIAKAMFREHERLGIDSKKLKSIVRGVKGGPGSGPRPGVPRGPYKVKPKERAQNTQSVKLPADIDKSIIRTRGVMSGLLPGSWSKVLKENGAEDPAIEEMSSLFDRHRWGKEHQERADAKIAEALKSDTPLGKALRIQVEVETELLRRWESSRGKMADLADNDSKALVKDLWDMGIGNNDAYSSWEEQWKVEEAYKTERLRQPMKFYRKGGLDKDILPTSLKSSGAQSHSVTGSVQPHFEPDHAWTSKELLDSGYKVLGGFGFIQMGYPGESEITWAKMSGSVGSKSFKASTATEWLEDHADWDMNSLEDAIFATPFGPVTLGFVTEYPTWMKDKIQDLLTESFGQDYWSKVNETTLGSIDDFLRTGLENGWSIAKMAEEIVPMLLDVGKYAEWRARNIARTEAGNALNGARVASANNLLETLGRHGLQAKKVWLSVLGTTTRIDHANLDGVPADKDDRWNLGGYSVRWPGDVILPPGQRCHCQCSVVVEFGMTDSIAQDMIQEYYDRVAETERLMQQGKSFQIRHVGVKLAGPHKFSSTQFNIEDGAYSRTQGGVLEKLKHMQSFIDKDDLHEKGLEDELHVTLKYGLHTEDPKDVHQLLRGSGPVEIRLGPTSIFEVKKDHEAYDVVKVSVDSPDLHRLNTLISESLECTDTFPEYVPHITLAYVKPGTGVKYTGMEAADGFKLSFTTLKFSNKEGVKTNLDLISSEKGGPGSGPRSGVPRGPYRTRPEIDYASLKNKKPSEWGVTDTDRLIEPVIKDGKANECYENARREYWERKNKGENPKYVMGNVYAVTKDDMKSIGGVDSDAMDKISFPIPHAWVEVNGMISDATPFKYGQGDYSTLPENYAKENFHVALYAPDRRVDESKLTEVLKFFPKSTWNDDKGGPGSGPRRRKPIESEPLSRDSDSEAKLTEHLSMVRGFMAQNHGAKELKHPGLEALALDEGQWCTPAPRPAGIRKERDKECFMNAFRLATSGQGLTYHEGYAYPKGIPLPIHHAWVTDKLGKVIDNTWSEPGTAYLGVPLTEKFIMNTAVETGVYGVFGGYDKTYRDILKNGLPDGAKDTSVQYAGSKSVELDEKNCGTGAGGFKPGNTCSRGSTEVKITHNGSSGKAWRESVEAGLQSIPDKLKKFVGASLETHDTLYDMELSIPKEPLWQAASGCFNTKDNRILIPNQNSKGINASPQTPGVVRHEYGHAFDEAIKRKTGKLLSEDKEFSKAYDKECEEYTKKKKLPPDPNTGKSFPKMPYFTEGPRRKSEFVAEAFAHLNGGAPTFRVDAMMQEFPKTLGIIQKFMDSIDD